MVIIGGMNTASHILFTAIFSLVVSVSSLACPLVSGMVDYNCDQKISVAVMGDSLVAGFGDTKNDNKGGYLLRAQKRLKDITVNNLGVPGMTTGKLLTLVNRIFKTDDYPLSKAALLEADYIILDLGRNDRWLFGEPVDTMKGLKKIRTTLQRAVLKETQIAPYVVIATLMLPNRGSQGPWVKDLNKYIRDFDADDHPTDLRFDLVSKRLLSNDQIHPTSKGYDTLARRFVAYLTKTLPLRALTQRVDEDDDGVFDVFEVLTFGTSITLADTDSDGKSDGMELFTTKTNPLVID